MRYDADSYRSWLSTFSNHIVMEPSKRSRLDDEVRWQLAQRPHGQLPRQRVSQLAVAQQIANARERQRRLPPFGERTVGGSLIDTHRPTQWSSGFRSAASMSVVFWTSSRLLGMRRNPSDS